MKYLINKHSNSKRKLLFKNSRKAAALFIAIAFAPIAGSFAVNDVLATNTVHSKFVRVSTDRVIKDQYIVVFKSDLISEQMAERFGQATINSASAIDAMNFRRSVVRNTASEMANSHNVAITTHYHAALPGFAAQMTKTDMRALLADHRVAYIEQDQIMWANIIQNNASFGLDRIDQENLPLDTLYNYDADGSGVHAYVLDTGILVSHSDFGGRAQNGIDLVDNDGIANDCNGHGTHVAGTIGSSTFGVAKNVTVVGVRVLGCDGSGPNSVVIAGIDWVTQNAIRPAVANMSLGGASSRALDAAVQRAINNGITFVVAAGNSNSNACIGSPNRVPNALTVASSTAVDTRSIFSSWGACVDLFAPGSRITSTWNNGGSVTISGTSMAAPHVAGVAALFLQVNRNALPATVNSAIISNAVSGKITGTNGSPNRLLQSRFNVSTPPPPPPSTLKKGVAVTNLSGSTASEIRHTLDVPAGAADLNFDISNGIGDVDLYVKLGSAPTTSSYDCRPYLGGNIENCNFSNPTAGTYFIMLRAFSRYSGVSLVGDYTVANGGDDSFFESFTNVMIPDNDSLGVVSRIDVVRNRAVGTIEIAVDVKHTYVGDLIVELYWPNGLKSTLQSRIGGSSNNLFKTYTQNAGSRSPAVGTGTWELRVKDIVGIDTGFIDSWSITFR